MGNVCKTVVVYYIIPRNKYLVIGNRIKLQLLLWINWSLP